MKAIKCIFALTTALIMCSVSFSQVQAQNKTATTSTSSTKTETFTVGGKCEMCKARIEKAAKVTGVTKAVWDQKTQKLSLTYTPSRVTVQAVQKAIAAVGHDAGQLKADKKVYDKLPGCCKYR